MIYSVLIFGSEDQVESRSPEEQDEMLGRHAALRESFLAQGRLGPVMRLKPRSGAVVKRQGSAETLVTDGPFAETKEQLMGLYTLECDTLEEAVAATRQLQFEGARFEIRPVVWFDPGVVPVRIPPTA